MRASVPHTAELEPHELLAWPEAHYLSRYLPGDRAMRAHWKRLPAQQHPQPGRE